MVNRPTNQFFFLSFFLSFFLASFPSFIFLESAFFLENLTPEKTRRARGT